MDDKGFDDIIKNKLDGFSSSEESDWSQFSSLLEDEKSSDDLFDDSISSVFANFKETYQPSHWEILKEKLESEEYIRTRLYLIKGIELTILILIYMGYSTIFNPYEAVKQRIASPVLMADNVVTPLLDSYKFSQKVESEDLNSNLSSNTTTTTTTTTTSVQQEHRLQIKNAGFTSENKNVYHDLVIAHSTNIRQVENKRSPLVIPAVLDREQAIANNILEVGNSPSTNYDNDELLEIANSKQIYLSSLPIPLKFIQYDISIPSQTYGFVKLYPYKKKSDNGLYASLSASFNADIIDSPDDNVYPNYSKYKNFSEGYSVGMGVVNRIDKWDLGVGVRYTQQAYSPRQISETTGGVYEGTKTTTLEKIAYDIVSLPFTANYRVVNKNSWNVFAMAGLSVSAIGTAAYVAQEEVNRRTVRRFNILDNNQVDQDLDYLSQKDFNLGIFEGGSVLDNLFLTGSFGVGVEKQIGNNTFINLSGSYRHHLFTAELGPNDDKINSFVWSLGAKYRI